MKKGLIGITTIALAACAIGCGRQPDDRPRRPFHSAPMVDTDNTPRSEVNGQLITTVTHDSDRLTESTITVIENGRRLIINGNTPSISCVDPASEVVVGDGDRVFAAFWDGDDVLDSWRGRTAPACPKGIGSGSSEQPNLSKND